MQLNSIVPRLFTIVVYVFLNSLPPPLHFFLYLVRLYLGPYIVYFHWMGGPGNTMYVAEGQFNGGLRHHAQPTRQN